MYILTVLLLVLGQVNKNFLFVLNEIRPGRSDNSTAVYQNSQLSYLIVPGQNLHVVYSYLYLITDICPIDMWLDRHSN